VSIDPCVDIGHVHLKVADIQRALDFYVGVLGFEEQAAVRRPGSRTRSAGSSTPASGSTAPPTMASPRRSTSGIRIDRSKG
jgi:catechol 2,3-dioxygenase